MVKTFDKNAQRMKRHTRVRGKISGTPERPRLNVYRSNANIYAQIIDDVNGVTIAAADSNEYLACFLSDWRRDGGGINIAWRDGYGIYREKWDLKTGL